MFNHDIVQSSFSHKHLELMLDSKLDFIDYEFNALNASVALI